MVCGTKQIKLYSNGIYLHWYFYFIVGCIVYILHRTSRLNPHIKCHLDGCRMCSDLARLFDFTFWKSIQLAVRLRFFFLLMQERLAPLGFRIFTLPQELYGWQSKFCRQQNMNFSYFLYSFQMDIFRIHLFLVSCLHTFIWYDVDVAMSTCRSVSSIAYMWMQPIWHLHCKAFGGVQFDWEWDHCRWLMKSFIRSNGWNKREIKYSHRVGIRTNKICCCCCFFFLVVSLLFDF